MPRWCSPESVSGAPRSSRDLPGRYNHRGSGRARPAECGGIEMGKSPTRIALALAAAGALTLLASLSSTLGLAGRPPAGPASAPAADPPAAEGGAKAPAPAVLFKNARVFDGKSGKVAAATSVLVV